MLLVVKICCCLIYIDIIMNYSYSYHMSQADDSQTGLEEEVETILNLPSISWLWGANLNSR